MNETKIRKWISLYESAETLENYLIKLYVKKPANLESERQNMASIARLLIDPGYVRDHDQYYRWKFMSSDDIVSDTQEWDSSIDSKKVLQLRVGDTWVDWVFIGPSMVEIGKRGLFAARNFCERFTIGVYSGVPVWTEDKIGGKQPEDEDMARRNVSIHYCCLWVRDSDCRMVLLDPTSTKSGNDPNLLRMGMHLVREIDDESKRNVVFVEDGSLQCTAGIRIGDELVLLGSGDPDEKLSASVQVVDAQAVVEEEEHEVKKPAAQTMVTEREDIEKEVVDPAVAQQSVSVVAKNAGLEALAAVVEREEQEVEKSAARIVVSAVVVSERENTEKEVEDSVAQLPVSVVAENAVSTNKKRTKRNRPKKRKSPK